MLSPDWLEILMGYRVVEVEGVKYDILLPTLSIIHESLFYTRKAEDGIKSTSFSEVEIDELQDQILTDEDIEFIDSFELKLAEYKRDLEIQTNAGKRQILRNRIKNLEEKKDNSDLEWQKIRSFTREGFGSLIQTHYCFSRCVRLHDTEEPLWVTYNEFLDDNRGSLTRELMSLFMNYTTEFTDSRLREIAKDGFYRIISQVMKDNIVTSFSSAKDISMAAIKLLYWIQYYSNTLQYSSEECPPDIIEDDDAFDLWAERQRKGVTDVQQGAGSASSSVVRGKTSETIIVA